MRRILRVWLAGVALVLAACSSPVTGSNQPATSATSVPSAAAPVSASPTATQGQQASEVATMQPTPFTISSSAFANGGAIPARFTCDGEDVSPDIEWSGAPETTKALVLVVVDPDARDFVHWLVFDIPGSPTGSLQVATSPAGPPPQGTNDFGKTGYGGPCPPSGRHRYVFSLSALDRTLGLNGSPRRADLEAAMKGHVLATAVLTGTYKRS
jgi:Raf kinase inhibitor-like YbhB/YbcL family protein